MKQWTQLPRDGPALLVEDSPWAYLAKHSATLDPTTRHQHYHVLAPLTLPDLTLVFHASGRAIGLRHPHFHPHPEEWSPTACEQMRSLDFLPSPTRHFDATPSPSIVCARVRKVLDTRVFDVAQTAFDGLDHLSSTPQVMTPSQATTLAAALPLPTFSTDPTGLQKLNKLARILQLNPDIVNKKLPPHHRAPYFQALHDHLAAFALDLEDLHTPADVTPFTITTFGPPVSRPPIRTSPAHTTFVRSEISTLKEHGLIRHDTTPWAAPCFPVPKPRSDKLRLVIDYRGLNAQTRRDSHPLPHIQDVLHRVGRHHVWSKLDLKSGFWQIPMH